jgi:hypothetical protein
MELVLRVDKVRREHEIKFHDHVYRHERWQALIDENGTTWELADDVPRYRTHPFSSSCAPIVANFDDHDNCLHLEKEDDIDDYLTWKKVQEARKKRT